MKKLKIILKNYSIESLLVHVLSLPAIYLNHPKRLVVFCSQVTDGNNAVSALSSVKTVTPRK